jgi:hypothetical protein
LATVTDHRHAGRGMTRSPCSPPGLASRLGRRDRAARGP